jgi:NADH dehydrogenase [ubiquinone] 1 alpha subcomplex assembly factor 1
MQATPILRAGGRPGFWRRSIDEFKRQATIAVQMQGMLVPKKPFFMAKFDTPASIPQCKVMCDSTSFGGFSKASLTWQAGESSSSSSSDATTTPTTPTTSAATTNGKKDASDYPNTSANPPHALFTGTISTALPPNKPEIMRSGFAAWRTHDRGMWLFGRLLFDIDPYTYLALRVKSDGRKYFINVQTESIVPTDIHQHLLPCFRPGEWETVVVPFHAFVRTNHGMVVEPQREMLRQKVRSIGIGLTDRVQGPFELRIAEVYATNHPPKQSADKEGDVPEEAVEKVEPEKIMI